MSYKTLWPICATHDSMAENETACFSALVAGHGDPAECIIKQFKMVPVDALVIVKEDGEWPQRYADAIEIDLQERQRIHDQTKPGSVGAFWLQTSFILDALAAAQEGKET